MTHIESLCYFWGQVADSDTAQVVMTLTEELASVHITQAKEPLRMDKVRVSCMYFDRLCEEMGRGSVLTCI